MSQLFNYVSLCHHHHADKYPNIFRKKNRIELSSIIRSRPSTLSSVIPAAIFHDILVHPAVGAQYRPCEKIKHWKKGEKKGVARITIVTWLLIESTFSEGTAQTICTI